MVEPSYLNLNCAPGHVDTGEIELMEIDSASCTHGYAYTQESFSGYKATPTLDRSKFEWTNTDESCIETQALITLTNAEP